MTLRWTEQAGSDLIELAERSPRRAAAVLAAVEWMSAVGFSLGRPVGIGEERYWPVPPLGVFYHVENDLLVVDAVIDTRRRREAW